MHATVFPIIPAAGKSLWVLAVIALVLLLSAPLMDYIAWSTRHVTCTSHPQVC